MMKIDVCIISGNFIENPKLVFNQNFHVIFSCQVIESIFTFPFLTVRFLLFQNSSDPDVHSLDPHPPLPPSLFFKGRGEGGSKFYYLHQRGEGQKNKKKGWKYGAGAGLLKKVVLFLFNFLGSYLRLEIILCKIVWYTFAKSCYAFEENYFFLPP